MRRIELRDLRPRPTDDDNRGTRIPRGAPYRGLREAKRDLTDCEGLSWWMDWTSPGPFERNRGRRALFVYRTGHAAAPFPSKSAYSSGGTDFAAASAGH